VRDECGVEAGRRSGHPAADPVRLHPSLVAGGGVGSWRLWHARKRPIMTVLPKPIRATGHAGLARRAGRLQQGRRGEYRRSHVLSEQVRRALSM